ncbi:MAG: hypothetical protein PCFJNLEI_01269 [Verrucomicrobiae bacterium]|nr:hypothetical protein [Verrucomicrobiae bacterium]
MGSQFLKLNADDNIIAYQTDTNELVGLARVVELKSRGEYKDVRLHPLETFQPGLRVRELKKQHKGIASIYAFKKTGVIGSLYKISSSEGRLLLKAAQSAQSKSVPSQKQPTTPVVTLTITEPPKVGPSLKKSKKKYGVKKGGGGIGSHDEQNRELGLEGEKLAFAWEKYRLRKAGRADLARRVQWVSQTEGDGLGYDIKSFETTGKVRFIEVKTTNSGKKTPFFISRREVEFASEQKKHFFLYRMFDFSTSPKMYVQNGALNEWCRLTPTQFLAGF